MSNDGDDRPRDKPLYPPNVAKPPPLPQRARELSNKDVQGYELDPTDRKVASRRAGTVNSGDGVPVRRSGGRAEPAGSGWVRAAVLLLILVAVSVGAYLWKGR